MKPPGRDDREKPLRLETHEDMRRNIRAVNRRLNRDPAIARMMFVNPVLALEDAGVELSAEMREHVMQSLRFPQSLQRTLDDLRKEICDDLGLSDPEELPDRPDERARLLFKRLGVLAPAVRPGANAIHWRDVYAHAREHPAAQRLARYERLSHGGMIFQPRSVYEAFKSGRRKMRWIKAIRFRE